MAGARGLLPGPLVAIVLRPWSLGLLSLVLGFPREYRSGWRSERDLGGFMRRIAAIGAGKHSDQECQHRNQDRCHPRGPKEQKASCPSLARPPQLFTEVL